MFGTGTVFITASMADYKAANRFLLWIRDRDYDSGDVWSIQQNRQEFEDHEDEIEAGSLTDADFAPGKTNSWAGQSIVDVEAHMLALSKADEADETKKSSIYTGRSALWVVLDDEGLREQNCVIAQRRQLNDDYWVEIEGEEEGKKKGLLDWDFDKVRLPWESLYGMWANLETQNMDFDDFTTGVPEEPGSGGWYKFGRDEGMLDSSRKQLEEDMKEFEKEGKI